MLLLFGAMAVSPRLLDQLEQTGTELLRHLSLLFVPAGVGIFVSAASLSGHWLAIIVSVVVSTILTIVVTAVVTRAVIRLQGKNEQGEQ